MSNKIQSDLSEYIAPPISGGVVNLTVAQTVVVIDLTSMAGWPGNQVNGVDVGQVGGKNTSPLAHYITICADGANVYVAFAGLASTLSTLTTTAVTTVVSNQLSTT